MAAFVDFSGPMPMFSQIMSSTIDLSNPDDWSYHKNDAKRSLNYEQQPLERNDSTKDYVTAVKKETGRWAVFTIRSKGNSILVKTEFYNPNRELTSIRFSYGKSVTTTSDSK